MSEFKIEKVVSDVVEPTISMPAMYQMFDIVEMEDEDGNTVKIKQAGMHISMDSLVAQKADLESQLADVATKIAMIEAMV